VTMSDARLAALENRTRPSFRLINDVDLLNQPSPKWVIESMIEECSTALVYGPPGSNKTNLMLGAAYSVARGVPWLGCETMLGNVVYVAAEGAHGLRARIHAQRERLGIDADKFSYVCFIPQPVQLLEAAHMDELDRQLSHLRLPPALVIFDTLARCTLGGDENSAQDMGQVVAHLDLVRNATGAAVVVVHHTNSSEARERGSTVLRGAVDTVLSVTADGPIITLTCEKQRNAEPFSRMNLLRRTVNLADGQTSCLLELIDEGGPSDLRASDISALDVLREVYDGEGLSYTRWKDATEISERTFAHVVKRLTQRGVVVKDDAGTSARYRPATAA